MHRSISSVVMVLAAGLGAAAPASAAGIEWNGRTFVEVAHKVELPRSIRIRLDMDPQGPRTPLADADQRSPFSPSNCGTDPGVADVGEHFNTGDTATPCNPWRGLVGAAHDGDTWLVAIATSQTNSVPITLYIFVDGKLVSEGSGGEWNGTRRSLAAVIAGLAKPAASLGGMAGYVFVGLPGEFVDRLLKLKRLATTVAPNGATEFRYERVSVWFEQKPFATRVVSSNPAICLISVCPGAPLAIVELVLGKPLDGGPLRNGANVYSVAAVKIDPPLPTGPSPEFSSCRASLDIASGKVASIEVSCAQDG